MNSCEAPQINNKEKKRGRPFTKTKEQKAERRCEESRKYYLKYNVKIKDRRIEKQKIPKTMDQKLQKAMKQSGSSQYFILTKEIDLGYYYIFEYIIKDKV